MRLNLALLLILSWSCATTAPEKKTEAPPALVEAPPASPNPVEPESKDAATPMLVDRSSEAKRLSDEGINALTNYDFVTATKKLKESLVFDKGNNQIRHALIAAYLRKGNVIEAMNHSQDWLESSPDSPVALDMRVRTLIRANRKSEADNLVSQYLAKHPNDLTIRNLQARIDLIMGFPKRAIRRSSEVMKKDEVNVGAVINIARAYLNLRKMELALYVVDQGLSVKKHPDLYHIMSQIYIERGDWQRAEAALRECLNLTPDFPEGLNNLGVVYQQVGDYNSAIVQLEKATQVAPGMLSAHLNLGNAYRGIKQFEKAEQSYSAVLKLDQSYADAYFNLGILFFENQVEGIDDEQRLQKAVTNFNQYKLLAGAAVNRKDPVDNYINEAKRMIEEVRRMREEEMKQPAPEYEVPMDSTEPAKETTPMDAPEPNKQPEPNEQPEPNKQPEPNEVPVPTDNPTKQPVTTPKPIPQPEPIPEPLPEPIPKVEPMPEPLPNTQPVPQQKPDEEPENEPGVEPLPNPDELPVPEDIPVPQSSSLDSVGGMR